MKNRLWYAVHGTCGTSTMLEALAIASLVLLLFPVLKRVPGKRRAKSDPDSVYRRFISSDIPKDINVVEAEGFQVQKGGWAFAKFTAPEDTLRMLMESGVEITSKCNMKRFFNGINGNVIGRKRRFPEWWDPEYSNRTRIFRDYYYDTTRLFFADFEKEVCYVHSSY